MSDTRYATAGGHSVAYQLVGDAGPPVLFIPGFVSNLELQWEHPPIARFLDRLAAGTRLVLFDKRGTGMSERASSEPVSIDDSVNDIRCVLDEAGIHSAHIFAVSEGGPLAAAFAAAHPSRTESLCLYGTFASRAFGNSDRARAFVDETAREWGTGRILGHLAPAWDDAASARFLARYERQSATPTAAARLVTRLGILDATRSLADVRTRTLVLHRASDPIITPDRGQALAEMLPSGRFLEVPGNDHFVYAGDSRRIIDEVHGFVGTKSCRFDHDRVFAAIAFIDIVKSTEHVSRLGDRGWRDLLDVFHETVLRTLGRHGGVRVNTLGDGVLVTFETASAAVRWSIDAQREASRLGLHVRVGLHASEIERRDRDVAGIGVHIAARVSGHAEPGQVVVTSTVRDLIDGSGIELSDRGVHQLRGITRPWHLFDV